MIVTLIPAAGQSSRMGDRDKLLETIKGEPILARTARIALEADLGPVIVTLRPRDKGRLKALRKHEVSVIEIADANEGMSASLRAGAKTAIESILAHDEGDYEYSGLMVLLPDMPEIDEKDLRDIAINFSSSGGSTQRATSVDGTPGHPVLFAFHVLTFFDKLTEDQGARSLLKVEFVTPFQLAGQRAITDLDTPEDWAAWRARTGIKF